MKNEPTAEHAVLGSIMLDAVRCIPLCVAKGITVHMFNDATLRGVFKTALETWDKRGICDSVLIAERFKELGKLDTIEGGLFSTG